MRILVANDDGVGALGLNVLVKTLKKIADVIVIAPSSERSATGHALSFVRPLRMDEIDDGIYSCDGYPADCVFIGLWHLLKDNKPDLVISGINHGANMAQDIICSGTVAAAREGAMGGVPSIAISLATDFFDYKHEAPVYFQTAADYLLEFLKNDRQKMISPDSILNINVPNLPLDQIKGEEITIIGKRHYRRTVEVREVSRERSYYWPGGSYEGFESIEGSDCMAVERNKVSICPITSQFKEDDQFKSI